MPYKSEVKLQIGETPKTQDQAAFPDMVDLFNSVHILLQYIEAVKELVQPTVTPDSPGYEVIPIRNTVYGKVAQAVEAGRIVTPFDTEYGQQWLLGGPVGKPDPVEAGETMRGTGLIALTLEAGEAGAMVKLGFGSAVVKIEGVNIGDRLYVRPALDGTSLRGDGAIYIGDLIDGPGGDLGNMIIGAGIGVDAAYIFDHVDAYATLANRAQPESDPEARSSNLILPSDYADYQE